MTTVQSQPAARPLGSYEFGAVMLLALFVAPLAIHVLAGLAL
jgi:hypothetical protein